MNAPSSNSVSVVSIRHVATGFMGCSDIILVIIRGLPHLVSCKINDSECGSDINTRFGLLIPSIMGNECLEYLSSHIAELRTVDAITEPVRWCCREGLMKDFSSLSVNGSLSAQDFTAATVTDLPVEVKKKIIEFSETRLRPRTGKGIRVRLKRVTIPVAA